MKLLDDMTSHDFFFGLLQNLIKDMNIWHSKFPKIMCSPIIGIGVLKEAFSVEPVFRVFETGMFVRAHLRPVAYGKLGSLLVTIM